GWVATLDGEPVDIYRVNYILRGVSVPEGQHTLQFNFKPRSYTLGNSLNAISTWLLLLLFITALVLEVRGLTNQPEEKEAN
ncbi:MAG TPA: hypothetical protein DCP28_11400, partial [Cytophagales bacterium]|nr:hypothetical protein [Cytophagales bacterium]